MATLSQPTLLPDAPLPGLNTTLGAVMIGAFICAVLYGIVCLQTFMLCQISCQDNQYAKYTVWVLWAVNTAHLAFSIHPCYWYMVTNYGRPATIDRIPWSISFGVFLTGINDVLVRSWFIYRIWILSRRNWYLTATLIACVATAFGFTIAVSAKSYRVRTFSVFRQDEWILDTDMSLVFVSDVVLALFLCFYLAGSRSSVLSRRIGTYINLLIVYTINTGLLTSLVAMACLITYITMPKSFVFTSFYFPMSSLYANSLLASFNMRDFFVNSLMRQPESFALSPSRQATSLGQQHGPHTRWPKPCHQNQLESRGDLVFHITTSEQSKAVATLGHSSDSGCV